MDNLSGSVSSRVRLTGTKTLGLGDFVRELTKSYETIFALGAGANQANNFYEALRTLTTGASESLDFVGGALLNPYGDSANMTEVKGLLIHNNHASQVLTVGGANNIPPLAGNSIPIRPGGTLLIIAPDAAGYTLVGGTADLITVANAAGATATYDIIVWGN